MIVVSGCPRSGTSLMMDLLRVALGEDRLIGAKFPQEERYQEFLKRQEDEHPNRHAMRLYIARKLRPNTKREIEKSRDMNPNGFWECLYTVRGVRYRFHDTERLAELLAEDDDKLSVCKIVSQGLAQSDPQYIHKVVYMLRHPRAVAKSQEKLRRKSFLNADGQEVNISDELQIHTPEMFINVTAAAARWMLKYPDVPVHFVHFDELLEEPEDVLTAVREFLGCSEDFTEAIGRIDRRLNRSKPEPEHEDPLWEDAEFVYDHFVDGEYQAILDYLDEPKRAVHREQRRWHCVRAGQIMTEKHCKLCRERAVVRENMKLHAEDQGVRWRSEPCAFECGFDIDNDEPLSMEESIANNFWED